MNRGSSIMTSVERVKTICKERKIPLSRLERECGFANGYISQLKKGTMPEDRLRKVADYLGVSAEFLATGEEQGHYYTDDEAREMIEFLKNNKDYKVLFDALKTIRPSDIESIKEFIEQQNGNT
jgi:transcriptional regulator with XRE-family HTH domain